MFNSALVARPEWRLVAFGLAAVAAVYLGFLGTSVATAETLVKRGGYYVMLFTFALWLASLWRLWRARTPAEPMTTWREGWLVGAVILGLTSLAFTHETFRCKILNDEFVLQSTAFNLHFFREVAVMVRGYDLLGTFLSTDNYLDKRPYFYPFLVSLVHDFTGYRVANSHALNAVLMPVALALAYWQGRCLAAWRGGLAAVILLGALPLFAQNASGAGMEMLNLTMFLATTALAGAWLARPDETRLSALLLATVLLAQCRYESPLYVLPVAVVVLVGWTRARRVILPWMAIATPLLFLPVALQNKVLSHSPILWEMKHAQTSRFGVEYVGQNLRGAWDFLLSSRPNEANSLVLTWVGAAGLLWVVWRLAARRRSPGTLAPMQQAWLILGVGVVANTVLVLFYFWSSFADPMAARFSLPFHLLLVFAAVALAGRWDHRWPASTALLLAAGIGLFAFSVPKLSLHLFSRVGIDEIEWERRFVAARPPGERLIITNKSTLPWLVQQTPSILINRARLLPDRLEYQLHEPTFREILVMQSLRPSTAEGDFQLLPEEKLPPGFVLELLAEKRFGAKIARVSRLVTVRPEALPSAR